MIQLTFAPEPVNALPFHLLRAEEDTLLSLPQQPPFGQFDYLPTDSTRLFFVPEKMGDVAHQLVNSYMTGDNLPFSSLLQSLFFLLFLLCFLLFAIFYSMEGSSFQGNLRHAFTPGKSTNLIRKEQVTITEAWGEFFLLFQTMLVGSIVLFHAGWDWGLSSLDVAQQLKVFGTVLVVISFFAAIKVFFYRVVGLFFLPVDLKGWVTQYTRMLELIGVVLFLPAVCFVYLPEWKEGLMILFAVIFLITRMIIVIGLLNIFVKNKIGWFYFFVYLCGTEIAPWLLFYKGVLSMINIAGINII